MKNRTKLASDIQNPPKKKEVRKNGKVPENVRRRIKRAVGKRKKESSWLISVVFKEK